MKKVASNTLYITLFISYEYISIKFRAKLWNNLKSQFVNEIPSSSEIEWLISCPIWVYASSKYKLWDPNKETGQSEQKCEYLSLDNWNFSHL